jgi:hypothetical protein
MYRSILFSLLLIMVFFSGCDLFDVTPVINMTCSDSTYMAGDTISVKINVNDMKKNIFAMSTRIMYDPDYLNFNATQSDWIGNIWSNSALGILEDVNNTIYISITEVAGGTDFKPNGTVFILNFVLDQGGETLIDFVDDQIFFYNKDGEVIDLTDIETQGISITIE